MLIKGNEQELITSLFGEVCWSGKSLEGWEEEIKNFYSWDKEKAEVHGGVPEKIKEDGDHVSDTSPKVPCKKQLPFAIGNP